MLSHFIEKGVVKEVKLYCITYSVNLNFYCIYHVFMDSVNINFHRCDVITLHITIDASSLFIDDLST